MKLLLILMLSGCANVPNFEAKTYAGAMCQKDCTSEQASCIGTNHKCQTAYGACLESCIAIDRLSR